MLYRQRRAFSLLAVVLVLATSGACSDDPAGGSFVVGAGADTSLAEPPEDANVSSGGGDVNAGVLETLVSLGEDFTVRPLLATSWEFRAPNTWRFNLRRNVKFHDGSAFDAGDVAYNVEEIWGKVESGILALGPGSARVVDDHTIDITPVTPNVRFVEQLVHPYHALRAEGTSAGAGTSRATTPTGTGPFRFVEYRQNELLRVKRFDGYWESAPQPRASPSASSPTAPAGYWSSKPAAPTPSWMSLARRPPRWRGRPTWP